MHACQFMEQSSTDPHDAADDLNLDNALTCLTTAQGTIESVAEAILGYAPHPAPNSAPSA